MNSSIGRQESFFCRCVVLIEVILAIAWLISAVGREVPCAKSANIQLLCAAPFLKLLTRFMTGEDIFHFSIGFFYRHFKTLGNSDVATYNGDIKSSEKAITRKGGKKYDRRKQNLYYRK